MKTLEQLREGRTRQAIQKCTEWLSSCVNIGWPKRDLDALEKIWWDHRDNNGNIILTPITENQKTKEEIQALAVREYPTYIDDSTAGQERKSKLRQGFVEGYTQCQEEYAAQSSDAEEFAEWVQLNYKKEDGYWFHNSGSSREHDIRDLYSIFLKEKGAHNG